MIRNIEMVDLKSQYNEIKDRIDDSILEVISNCEFINGSKVKEFASALSNWNKTKHTIPCANGTDGLQIALMALGLEPDDEVIVPAFTYIATVEVISLLKLKPIFVDVYPDTFNMKVESIHNVISDRTKVIMPVHLYGQCSEMDEINKIAEEHKLFVIEDLAQAIGSEYKGTKVGNLGNIGVTSFFPSKNLGCYGDGGALLTNDDELAGKIKMIANHGQSEKYIHDIIGVNSRLDTVQAAILIEKLKELNRYIENRQGAANVYDNLLTGIDEITIPHRSSNSTHVFHQYTIKVVQRRDDLKKFLQAKGIPSMIYYPLTIPQQSAYSHLTNKSFIESESLVNQVLSLPMHTHLSKEDQIFICDSIKSFFHA
ncbi:MAG: DegT/DnrJ/EryC1/StrS family aminotransferase [Cyclobacteriaceae bacterium]